MYFTREDQVRRVLITGAWSGIGAALTATLAARGVQVRGLDVVDSEHTLSCDVTDQDSVDAAVAEAIAQLGGLDALVNCAGISPVQSATEPPGRDAIETLNVNLLGPWRVTAAALPSLRESRGRVINVASGLAHLTMPFAPAYCMSKRGLMVYSDALRLEEDGAISVTTVYPGYVRTPIHRHAARDGISLEGIVPAEHLDDVVGTLTRAVLGRRPVRDLATTRRGRLSYFLIRHLPPSLVDRGLRRMLQRAARAGSFDDSALARPLRDSLLGGTTRPPVRTQAGARPSRRRRAT